MPKNKPLNDRTPKWFKDWHRDHYTDLVGKVKFNSKLVWLILGAIIASGVASNNAGELLQRLLVAILGG